MKRFSTLLDRLGYQAQRNGKLRLLTEYFAEAPDPDRGYGLAALTGGLEFKTAKPALLRGLVTERVDPVLFELSYDYVGDMAETIALIWPGRDDGGTPPPALSTVVDTLEKTSKSELPGRIADWFDTLDPTGRWALAKLITGGLRVGVSARLTKTALAQYGNQPVETIEELWHGLEPPYTDFFAWLDGRAEIPKAALAARFRPVMLAHSVEDGDFGSLDPDAFRAEWKWDGIRVQAVSADGVRKLYSRTGDDISGTFPDVIEAMEFDGAIDGELLVVRDGVTAPFADLQKRLNRKTVSKKLRESHPALIRAYDLLVLDGEDIRDRRFDERRARLEDWHARATLPRFDLSALVPFASWDELRALRADPPELGVEGLMLKHGDSPYLQGRVKGHWFKWKRDPFLVDAVLLYAQRGHGKRSSFYSDYTFGVWRDTDDGAELVPVGKAYFGFTDEELAAIDKFVRNNTINRFGPVREVTHEPETGLVLEIAFEGLQRSTRHKSGLAMRFPRIHRLRWDKPPAEADRIEVLEALLTQS